MSNREETIELKKYIETIGLSTYSFRMKKRRVPDKKEVEVIRDQLLDFACAKHDFKLEAEEYLPEGDWNGVFIVKFRDNPEEDRLYCSAPSGEQFIKFRLDLTVDERLWQREQENIFREASEYDIAVCPSPTREADKKRHCQLSTRAWVPNLGQRIFGLTFSNLMDCKEAILSMLSCK